MEDNAGFFGALDGVSEKIDQIAELEVECMMVIRGCLSRANGFPPCVVDAMKELYKELRDRDTMVLCELLEKCYDEDVDEETSEEEVEPA